MQKANSITLSLAEEVTFFNKSSIIKELESIPMNSKLIIDVSKSKFIDFDIVSIFEDFKNQALAKKSQSPLKQRTKALKTQTRFIRL